MCIHGHEYVYDYEFVSEFNGNKKYYFNGHDR